MKDEGDAALSAAQRKQLRSLKTSEARAEHGEVLLEGARLVGDALDAGAPLTCCVVERGREARHAALLDRLRAAGVPVLRCTARDAAAIAATQHAQGVFATARWRMAAADDCLPADGAAGIGAAGIVVALHGAADPGNLGTILRTSDWFGLRALLLSAGSVDPGNPKVVRASMGSLFRVATGEYADLPALIRLARERRYAVAVTGAQPSGGRRVSPVDLDDALQHSLSTRMLLLLGSEAHGLPEEARALADYSLHIPRRGGAESLNLATAHGILLFALLQTRRGLLISHESPPRSADA